ncbi:alkaline phosphatase [Thermocoleostomius sinensis]|uniref:Alkaline phosphatase n=1 Tax=Thermocoleostomius sinensis A174 TaxID=2016057 RepID=A0A9E8ZH23_9CYAN|nr:alkaline phosphatase [Thermocoleostomius sinensis]WAL61065.1 alkaline phosphatase [Thermocoleostomius sinensis A174]
MNVRSNGERTWHWLKTTRFLCLLICCIFYIYCVVPISAVWAQPGQTRSPDDPLTLGAVNPAPVRIWPVNNTTLITGQRFDLRVETTIPAEQPPMLQSLTINGEDVTRTFQQGIEAEMAMAGGELEVGMPPADSGFLGQTLRNYSFDQPGNYEVSAIVTLDGEPITVTNTYRVQNFQPADGLNKIILMMGDGMGTPLRTGARIMEYGIQDGQPAGHLQIEQMPELALVSTHSLNSLIPDSANTAAAWVSGAKTINNALNAFPDNTPDNPLDNPRVETLPQYMKRNYNWGIGMVTTAFLTDATPSSFASNIRHRNQYESIAQQYFDFYDDAFYQPATGYQSLAELTQPVDVLLGPGARHFIGDEGLSEQQFKDGSVRRDNQDLITVAKEQGYTFVTDLQTMNAAPNDRPIFGLFLGDFRPDAALGPQNIPSALDLLVSRGQATIRGRGAADLNPPIPPEFATIPMLEEMTAKGITVLNTLYPNGWMLQVESSQSDKLAHPLDPDRTLYEVLTLDQSVGVARAFAAQEGTTLILVTADHAQGQTVGGTVDTLAIQEGRIDLQEAMRSFTDAGFSDYRDLDANGYPDESDPPNKLVLGISARPAFRTDFLTDDINLDPALEEDGSTPNPARNPDGLLLTADLERSTTVANHTADDVPLAAEGPGSSLFNGVIDNIEIFQRMAAAISGVRERGQLAALIPSDRPSVLAQQTHPASTHRTAYHS